MLMEYLRGDHNQPLVLGAEQNGKTSSGKRMRHINIWYFFITYRVNMKEISIDWCPTKKMVADFVTKPQEGSQLESGEITSWVKWDAWDAIKPKVGVVGLSWKKASKKLFNESKVWVKVMAQEYWYHCATGVCWGHIVQTVPYGRRTDRGQTASWSIFSLKIQGVDISPPSEFPHSFHTIVLRMTNR